MKRVFLFLMLSLLITSCSVTKTATAKKLDIYGSGVMHIPVVADLKVQQQKVSATIVTDEGVVSESAKQKAIAEAIEKANADILVEPNFKTKTEGSMVTITVTGFPATYKNFRNATQTDVDLLRVGILQESEKAEGGKESKKSKGWLWGLLGVAALIPLLLLNK